MLALVTFPLATYCLFLAFLNGRRRPTVLAGNVDLMFLAVGLSGLFLAGPGRLLIPLNVLTFWGDIAWLLWAAFYLIVVQTVVWKLRRRIVIYNFPIAEMVPKLWEVVRNLDASAEWVGNSMTLPKYGIQFYFEVAPGSRNVVLVATRTSQSVASWQNLEMDIELSFRTIHVRRGPTAFFFFIAAVSLGGIGGWAISYG